MRYVETDNDNLIMTWSINRPNRGNGLGTAVASELSQQMQILKEHLAEWEKDNFRKESAPCRVLVIDANLCGKKRDIWISGGDLKELATIKNNSDAKEYVQAMSRICRDLENLPIPVIACIGGAAIGGGVEFALAADMRFGCPKTSFQFKQLTIGLSTGYSSSKRLIRLLGMAQTKQVLFLRQTLNAIESKNLGLLTNLYTSESELKAQVKSICTQLIEIEPSALAAQKKILQLAFPPYSDEQEEKELELFASLWLNPTHKAYLKHFIKSVDR
ncbi:MAG: enoyl-CoA hydratase/isomerase family protein [Bdellovibrionota bacterium]